jgi:hypothetical protein
MEDYATEDRQRRLTELQDDDAFKWWIVPAAGVSLGIWWMVLRAGVWMVCGY